MEITGIAACMAQPNMSSYEREKLLENWVYHLMRTSLSFANHFLFLFERMLAGGNRKDCPRFGKQWPIYADGEPSPGNGFTEEDIEWIKDPSSVPMPAGIKDKMYNFSGAAFQIELFGGAVVFSKSDELAGPWAQSGYPFLT